MTASIEERYSCDNRECEFRNELVVKAGRDPDEALHMYGWVRVGASWHLCRKCAEGNSELAQAARRMSPLRLVPPVR